MRERRNPDVVNQAENNNQNRAEENIQAAQTQPDPFDNIIYASQLGAIILGSALGALAALYINQMVDEENKTANNALQIINFVITTQGACAAGAFIYQEINKICREHGIENQFSLEDSQKVSKYVGVSLSLANKALEYIYRDDYAAYEGFKQNGRGL